MGVGRLDSTTNGLFSGSNTELKGGFFTVAPLQACHAFSRPGRTCGKPPPKWGKMMLYGEWKWILEKQQTNDWKACVLHNHPSHSISWVGLWTTQRKKCQSILDNSKMENNKVAISKEDNISYNRGMGQNPKTLYPWWTYSNSWSTGVPSPDFWAWIPIASGKLTVCYWKWP